MEKQMSSIKQILVALDGSQSSISALENGVKLAVRLNAELVGLFVEDINLLRATQLPFTQEISMFSTGYRRLEALELERQLRVQADRVRRIMDRITHAKNLSARFQVVRGSVAEEILIASKDADLLMLGKTGRSLPGFGRFGSTVRSVVVQRPGMTLVWHLDGADIRPVVLAYDGSESAGKGLLVAFSLQEAQDSGLIVYLVAESQEKGHELRLEVSNKLKELGGCATFRTLVRPDFENLTWMLRSENAGPIVLPCNQKRVTGEHLCSLLEEITNPVLLVK